MLRQILIPQARIWAINPNRGRAIKVLDAGGSIASTLRTKTDPQKEERLPPAGLDGKE